MDTVGGLPLTSSKSSESASPTLSPSDTSNETKASSARQGLTFSIDFLEGGPVARLLDLTELGGQFTHAKFSVPCSNGHTSAGGCERNQ